jgi:(1->4)-alpha-D-glucan 1-alpha-D-glucosylmutase
MAQVDDLFRKAAEIVAGRQLLPESTYRLQFHAGFTFRDAEAIVPYLAELGITHCYSSPYLKARPGSKHGYDIIDHRLLNPEIGTDTDYEAFVTALRANGVGQILDVVPNHMGILGNENAWWNDVLENGPSSPYAGYFDISWYVSLRAELLGRLLLPVLGDPYGKVLESGEIRLTFAGGAFTLCYFEHRFPVAPDSYGTILSYRVEELEALLGSDSPALHEYQSVMTAVKNLPRYVETDPPRRAERQREKEVIKRRLATLTDENAPVRQFLEQTLTAFNGTPGEPRTFDLLDALLNQQPYRLAYWRVAADEINYRRFFDINELAALNMEREDVFTATHELIFRLLGEQKVDGLRIDHPDGLFDPGEYLRRLQRRFLYDCACRVFDTDPEFRGQEWTELEGPLLQRIDQGIAEWGARSGDAPDQPANRWPLYTVVEKILGAGEALPDGWPTHGTSGYDFLNLLNGLFVDAGNADAFRRLYREWVDDFTTFAEVVYQRKFLILQVSMASELHALAYLLDRLAQRNRWSRDFTVHTLRHALREVIACFPVYRSYITAGTVRDADRKYVQSAVKRAMNRNPAISASVFQFLRKVLLLESPEPTFEDDREEQRRFAGKFEQVTAPVMAKGMEDTAFYVYNCLLSLNEVGGNPARFGTAPEVLHRFNRDRRAKWAGALSATSTHDTKRSEDVRARLNVLSEIPAEWQQALQRWSKLNTPHRIHLEDAPVPDANEEYVLYQTLLGAWPLEPYSPEEYAEFVFRIQEYLTKALHEAKVHSSWINPNTDYDDGVRQFVARILDPQAAGAFLGDFRPFQRRVSHFGLLNSLAQAVVKLAAPGVADVYQGTEVWDFSLVDPDNRRPVDYERRRRQLTVLRARARDAGPERRKLAGELMRTKEDGRVKLYVLAEGLRCRREHPGLFGGGDYLPLDASGARQEHVFAFARRQGNDWAVAIVPRLLTRLVQQANGLPVGRDVWQDTSLLLPEGARTGPCVNAFTGERLPVTEREGRLGFLVADVLEYLPVALFVSPSRA